MDLGYELCVFQNGKWCSINFFGEDQEDEAMQQAIDLKRSNSYTSLCLISEKTRSIIYSYDKDNKEISYSSVINNMRNKDEKTSLIINKNNKNSLLEPEHPLEEPTNKSLTSQQNKHKNSKNSSKNNKHYKKPHTKIRTTKDAFILNESINVPKSSIYVSILSLIILGLSIKTLNPQILGILILLAINVLIIITILSKTVTIKKAKKTNNNKHDKNQEHLEIDFNILEEYNETNQQIIDIIAPIIKQAKELHWNKGSNKLSGDYHFALILFLSGFSKQLSLQLENIDKKQIITSISKSLEELNIDREMSLGALINIDEYILYSRYSDIFNFGMQYALQILNKNTTKSNNQQAKEINLSIALEHWNSFGKDYEQQLDNKSSAILFTDIVEFTHNQQTRGDEWMVEVLQDHNKTIRDNLNQYQGKEIKHTGDGILASFKNPINAVNAALEMQKRFKTISQEKQTQDLKVRISISAGEPIHIDGDIFGTPVNLAARILPYAEAYEIVISQTLHDICNELDFNFTEIKDCKFKGFEGTHSIYKLKY